MDIETAAQLMGMKPDREVRQVVPVDDGHAVLTHDGRWTLIRADGSMEFGVAEPSAPEPNEPVVQGDAPEEKPMTRARRTK